MENNNISQFIKQVAEQEQISEKRVKDIIINSFQQSYSRSATSTPIDLLFEFNHELVVAHRYQIVEKVVNPDLEISVKDAKLLKGGRREGNTLLLPLDLQNLPFSLSQEIKKNLQVALEEVQQTRRHELYKSLVNEIIFGSIRSIQKSYCLVSLERAEDNQTVGYWGSEEWSEWKKKPYLGHRYYFLVKEIQKDDQGGPKIILTRRSELFIHWALAREVPEVKEEIITIRHILQLPGQLSKVIVESKNPNVKALGACLGRDFERIRSVHSLVYPERVEIVPWTEKKEELLFYLFLPVRVVLKEKGENNWDILVPRKMFSLLLEKEGRVLKMIEEYLEKKIHAQILEEAEFVSWRGRNGELTLEEYQKIQENEK